MYVLQIIWRSPSSSRSRGDGVEVPVYLVLPVGHVFLALTGLVLVFLSCVARGFSPIELVCLDVYTGSRLYRYAVDNSDGSPEPTVSECVAIGV